MIKGLMFNNVFIEISAYALIIIFLVMFLFQLSLAFGAPFGKLAWGGVYNVLPASLRFGSFISAIIFLFGIMIVSEKALFYSLFYYPILADIFIWLFVVLFGLSTIGNLFSKSKYERLVMTPIAFLSFCFCLIIAIGN